MSSHKMGQEDSLTAGPSTAAGEAMRCQSQQNNLLLPQNSTLSQSNAPSSLVSGVSSLPDSSQRSSLEFGQLQLSLQDMAGVKSFISGLSLGQHQLQHAQGNQPQQLSPNCDTDLQSFADLVSKTLGQEMDVDFSQTQEEQQQAAQQAQPKHAGDVRISLSPLGQPTFHLQMEKTSHSMLSQPHGLSLVSSPLEQQNPTLPSFPQLQQNHQHGTLAPIQSLLSSLCQKPGQQGSSHRVSDAVLPSSHSDLPSESDLARPFDLHSHGTNQQKPTENGEIEDFLESVAFDLENGQDSIQLQTGTDGQVQILQVDKKELQQQLPKPCQNFPLQLSQKPLSTKTRGSQPGLMLSQSCQVFSRVPASASKKIPEMNTDQYASPSLVDSHFKYLNNVSAQPACSPVTSVRPASLPAVHSNITFVPSISSPVVSNAPKKVTNTRGNYPVSQAIRTNKGMFMEDMTPVPATCATNYERAAAVNNSCLTTFSVSAPSYASTYVAKPPGERAILNPGSGKTGAGFTATNHTTLLQPALSTCMSPVVSSSNRSAASPVPGCALGDQIWMNLKTPLARLIDKKATQALIQLVRQPCIRAKLASAHTKKKEVWNEIGLEMKKQGFIFSHAGEKCSQKWRNMERTFNDYELTKNIPSLKHKQPPDFYSELSSLLKDRQDYKGLLDEEFCKKKLVEDYMEMSYHQSVPDEDSFNSCDINTETLSLFAPVVTTSVTSTFLNEVTSLKVLEAANAVETTSSVAYSFPSLSVSVTPAVSRTLNSSSSKPFPVHSSCVVESPSSSLSSSSSSSVPILTSEKASNKTEKLEAEVKHLKELVQTQSKEIERMSEVLNSVQSLLRDQRRDSETVRAESGRRFSELKALIGQNQREKMKFMYDFLRALKPGRQPKRIKSQAGCGSQGST